MSDVIRSNALDHVIRGEARSAIIRGGKGGPGQPADVGFSFDIIGALLENEPPIPRFMPTSGTLSAANSGGGFIVPPTGTAVYLVSVMAWPDGDWTLFDTVTVSPAGVVHAFANPDGPNPYDGPCLFKCDLPATPDATLQGLSIFMGGP